MNCQLNNSIPARQSNFRTRRETQNSQSGNLRNNRDEEDSGKHDLQAWTGELRILGERKNADSTHENFLSWTVVNFPKYSFDHVNSADDSSKDTDEGEIDGKRSETPR